MQSMSPVVTQQRRAVLLWRHLEKSPKLLDPSEHSQQQDTQTSDTLQVPMSINWRCTHTPQCACGSCPLATCGSLSSLSSVWGLRAQLKAFMLGSKQLYFPSPLLCYSHLSCSHNLLTGIPQLHLITEMSRRSLEDVRVVTDEGKAKEQI